MLSTSIQIFKLQVFTTALNVQTRLKHLVTFLYLVVWLLCVSASCSVSVQASRGTLRVEQAPERQIYGSHGAPVLEHGEEH